MIENWNLNYWNTPDWATVSARLEKDIKDGHGINPKLDNLFDPLHILDPDMVSVAIFGQDPYPEHGYSTGTAFSIPRSFSEHDFPRTLKTIFKERKSDLGYDIPSHGDLSRWVDQGVFLWNVIPSCRNGASLSHDWREYHALSREITERLSNRGIVFAFLGQVSRRFFQYVDERNNEVLVTAHPSPRGKSAKNPFKGSRLFSTINDKLCKKDYPSIDWET